MPTPNDGGVIVALFLMVAAVSFALFQSVVFYASATGPVPEGPRRVLRLISGWANVGNGVVHLLLVIFIKANDGSGEEYWVEERKLGGIEGPVFLLVANMSAGLFALIRGGMTPSIVWNSFVAMMGTLMPIVWPRFLSTGMEKWPYVIIFIWFAIFAMELTAVTSSLTWFSLRGVQAAKQK